MNKTKVLFVCIHNSARSQMAEAFLKEYGGEKYEAESAGLEPGKLNPLVVKVMAEAGIDISKNSTNDVFEFFREGRKFHYVITVCDGASGERCPVFPGAVDRIAWSFEDPSTLKGGEEDKLMVIRKIRDEIKEKVLKFISENQ